MDNPRQVIDLNNQWLYFDENLGAKKIFSAQPGKGKKVTLPHSNCILPYHNFDEKAFQFISWYRNSFRLPTDAKGKRVFVEFDGVMLAAKVYLNGKLIGEHKGGFTAFKFDLTKHVKFTGDNVLAVEVDSRERADIPPFGGDVDYLTFGGIYREARLIITNELYISDIFPMTINVLKDNRALLIQYDIQNAGKAKEVQIEAQILDSAGKVIAQKSQAASIKTKELLSANICLQELEKIELWDIDDPKLYNVRLNILENGKQIDRLEKSFGFREAHFAKDGKFYLNGKPVKLVGLDRHQNYPYVGPAMGWRMQYRDAEILKNELSLNIVRTSHYPQSPHFLDRCDQLGLLVLEEIPGWQHIGDEKWKKISCSELKEMIIRDRHHPSIVLWGVRINESADDHDFYTLTNKIAHEMDPSRQTGGIRYNRESEFLEDVFTYNDFSGQVQPPKHIPHLITEFAGHTFPTKSFDFSQRQVEHSLLHARIQNQQFGNPQVAGAIGWCAFDYNTHFNFGAGDKICYHGVTDIFRLPKPASHFYKSQKDPKNEIVLELADLWIRGDWNTGIEYLAIFSNCDQIIIDIDGKTATLEPAVNKYPNLPHPPFIIYRKDFTHTFSNLKLIGKIKGKTVAKKQFAADKWPMKLNAWLDHDELIADGRDTTQLSFMITDDSGHPFPHATGTVTIETKGNIEIIGENPFTLAGGRGAVYIKAGTKKGTSEITIKNSLGHQAKLKLKLL